MKDKTPIKLKKLIHNLETQIAIYQESILTVEHRHKHRLLNAEEYKEYKVKLYNLKRHIERVDRYIRYTQLSERITI